MLGRSCRNWAATYAGDGHRTDEELLAINTALLYGLADLVLVPVHLGRVDVSSKWPHEYYEAYMRAISLVSCLERGQTRCGAGVSVLEHTEA